jgi:crotonobetainyl-CoA:carnitine CoA-transferase CaiB-like acyl-CoA transferase
MSVTGERDDLGGGPQKVACRCDLMTGMYATVGILAARTTPTGEGQHVDAALLDAQVPCSPTWE